MEVILILLVAGVIGSVFFIDKHTRKRAITIARSNKAITSEQQEVSDAEMKRMFKELRDAKDHEKRLLTEDWDAQFIDLLPDSDPIKQVVLRKKAGINSEEAKFVLAPGEFVAEELTYSVRITKNLAALRESPTLSSETLATLNPHVSLKVDGWVRGEMVRENDIWFRVDDSNGVYATSYIWSGSLNDPKTKGIPQVQPGQRSLAPAAQRDLMREIERLNSMVEKLPKSLNPQAQLVPINSNLTQDQIARAIANDAAFRQSINNF